MSEPNYQGNLSFATVSNDPHKPKGCRSIESRSLIFFQLLRPGQQLQGRPLRLTTPLEPLLRASIEYSAQPGRERQAPAFRAARMPVETSREVQGRSEPHRPVRSQRGAPGRAPRSRAGLPEAETPDATSRRCHSPLDGRRRKSWVLNAGAMHPDPVVNPGSFHWRMWAMAGRSPIPLTTLDRSTRRNRPSR